MNPVLFRNFDAPVTRRQALGRMGRTLAAGMAAGLAVPGSGNPAPVRPPNIVFILGDNHNAGAMGCAGHPFIRTPGMDRLAKEGVRFENTFNTTPLCSPSRASILTGVYAGRHGVKNNHTPWTGEMTTFLEHLSRRGYATAFTGKWHMPGKGLPDLSFLDLFVTYTYREGQGAYFNCPLVVNGKETLSRKPYITEEINDYAMAFMEQAAKDPGNRPFCVYISHRPGHPPFKAPKEITGIYDKEDLTGVLPAHADPLWYGKTKGNVFQGVMMGTYQDQYRRYCETITAMDRDIEKLLQRLDHLGLSDNTLVIYMGDNGMQWGRHDCHGIREPYEDALKLPFIVRAPWLIPDPGRVRQQMALNIDIDPTLLDLAGLPIPGDMDGQSLLPLLSGPDTPGREDWLMEFWRYFPENTPSYQGVRTRTHKYVRFERGRRPWLFDLTADPGEMHNLYGTHRGREVLPDLEGRLNRLLAGR